MAFYNKQFCIMVCQVWHYIFQYNLEKNETSDGVDNVIQEASEILLSIADQLNDSSISMGRLEQLHPRKDIFCSLIMTVDKSKKYGTSESLLFLIERKLKEVQKFKQARHILHYFLSICEQLPDGLGK